MYVEVQAMVKTKNGSYQDFTIWHGTVLWDGNLASAVKTIEESVSDKIDADLADFNYTVLLKLQEGR
jgi:hypothetical protein